jgi:thioester reductase-like protein
LTLFGTAWADIPPIVEGPITDLSLISSSGYGESKWVSERLLWAAGQSTALRPIIIRVGQLSGGMNGNWNVREWFPALARASQVVGGVPENFGVSVLSSIIKQVVLTDIDGFSSCPSFLSM